MTLEELLRKVCTCPDAVEVGYFERTKMWRVRVYASGAEVYDEEYGPGRQLYVGTFESPLLYNALNAAHQKVRDEQRKRPFRPQIVK